MLQRIRLLGFLGYLCAADEEEKVDEDNSRICRCDLDTMALLIKPEKLSREACYRRGMMETLGSLKQIFGNA